MPTAVWRGSSNCPLPWPPTHLALQAQVLPVSCLHRVWTISFHFVALSPPSVRCSCGSSGDETGAYVRPLSLTALMRSLSVASAPDTVYLVTRKLRATPRLTNFQADFLDNGEGECKQTPSDVCMEVVSRRDRSEATIFASCGPLDILQFSLLVTPLIHHNFRVGNSSQGVLSCVVYDTAACVYGVTAAWKTLRTSPRCTCRRCSRSLEGSACPRSSAPPRCNP